jgi:hypothetical protein
MPSHLEEFSRSFKPRLSLFHQYSSYGIVYKQKKSLDFGLSRHLKFRKLPIVVHRQKNFGPKKLRTSINGTCTGSEILVKGKYSF